MNVKIILFTILMMRLIGNLIMKWSNMPQSNGRNYACISRRIGKFVNCK